MGNEVSSPQSTGGRAPQQSHDSPPRQANNHHTEQQRKLQQQSQQQDSYDSSSSGSKQFAMRVVIRGSNETGKTLLFRALQRNPPGVDLLRKDGGNNNYNYVHTQDLQSCRIDWRYRTSDEVVKVEVWDVPEGNSAAVSKSDGVDFNGTNDQNDDESDDDNSDDDNSRRRAKQQQRRPPSLSIDLRKSQESENPEFSTGESVSRHLAIKAEATLHQTKKQQKQLAKASASGGSSAGKSTSSGSGGSFLVAHATANTVDSFTGTHAIVITFNPAIKSTWVRAQEIVCEALRHRGKPYVLLLCNFRDLPQSERTVSLEAVRRWCDDEAYRAATETGISPSSLSSSDYSAKPGPGLATAETLSSSEKRSRASQSFGEGGQRLRVLETSMIDGFGLQYISTFFQLPFLALQRRLLEERLAQNLAELRSGQEEVEAVLDAQNYAAYTELLQQKRKHQETFRAQPATASSPPLSSSLAIQASGPAHSQLSRTTSASAGLKIETPTTGKAEDSSGSSAGKPGPAKRSGSLGASTQTSAPVPKRSGFFSRLASRVRNSPATDSHGPSQPTELSIEDQLAQIAASPDATGAGKSSLDDPGLGGGDDDWFAADNAEFLATEGLSDGDSDTDAPNLVARDQDLSDDDDGFYSEFKASLSAKQSLPMGLQNGDEPGGDWFEAPSPTPGVVSSSLGQGGIPVPEFEPEEAGFFGSSDEDDLKLDSTVLGENKHTSFSQESGEELFSNSFAAADPNFSDDDSDGDMAPVAKHARNPLIAADADLSDDEPVASPLIAADADLSDEGELGAPAPPRQTHAGVLSSVFSADNTDDDDDWLTSEIIIKPEEPLPTIPIRSNPRSLPVRSPNPRETVSSTTAPIRARLSDTAAGSIDPFGEDPFAETTLGAAGSAAHGATPVGITQSAVRDSGKRGHNGQRARGGRRGVRGGRRVRASPLSNSPSYTAYVHSREADPHSNSNSTDSAAASPGRGGYDAL